VSRLRHAILAGVCLAAGAPAGAGTLATSFIHLEDGGVVNCNAVNVGSKPVSMTIRVWESGATLHDEEVVEVAPQGVGQLAFSVPAESQGFHFCEFEFKGSRKAIRALMAAFEPGSSVPFAVIPAQ
jgi:hypothetical protein